MRINRRSLIRVVKNTVDQRTMTDRGLISIYLGGSLIDNDYSLGGAVDIDLFFIHAGLIEQEREIIRLTDEVHLDIAHHDQKLYRDTRNLRVDPWMGPGVNECEIYYDPGHFMDFTQASVRGQYDRPDYVLERARKQADAARKIWFDYEFEHPEIGPKQIQDFIRALWNAGNTLASLSGSPLTERTYLLKLPQRFEVVGRPDLFADFMGLLGARNIEIEAIKDWLPLWETAYDAMDEAQTPARLHPVRKQYYLKAFNALLEGEQPGAVLWPLLNTWTHVVCHYTEGMQEMDSWCGIFHQLGFLEEGFGEKIQELDAFLDKVEETTDDWARSQGIL